MRWPKEYITQYYFKIHCDFSVKLDNLLDLFQDNNFEDLQYINLFKLVDKPPV